jgi:hypothetical protein
MLAASLTKANLDSLSQAALSPALYPQLRDLNLRHGIKAAAVAAELVKALDNRGRDKSEKVTVGKVNVEAGGQAIVGNVETGPSPQKHSKTD